MVTSWAEIRKAGITASAPSGVVYFPPGMSTASAKGARGGGGGGAGCRRPLIVRTAITPSPTTAVVTASRAFFVDRMPDFVGGEAAGGGSESWCSICVQRSRTCSHVSWVSMCSPRIQPNKVSTRVVPGCPSATRACNSSLRCTMSLWDCSGERGPATARLSRRMTPCSSRWMFASPSGVVDWPNASYCR